MLCDSDTWALSVEQMAKFDRMEMRIVHWMSGIFIKEHWSNDTLQERIGIEPVSDVLRKNRLK